MGADLIHVHLSTLVLAVFLSPTLLTRPGHCNFTPYSGNCVWLLSARYFIYNESLNKITKCQNLTYEEPLGRACLAHLIRVQALHLGCQTIAADGKPRVQLTATSSLHLAQECALNPHIPKGPAMCSREPSAHNSQNVSDQVQLLQVA